MITTKYAFRQWLHKKYPDIVAYPIYGMPAYILSQPLDEFDTFTYNVQQMPNGQYIVFIGSTIDEVREMMTQIKTKGVPTREHKASEYAPTTFSAFEQWLVKNNVSYVNRTFCSNKTPSDCFHMPYTQCVEKRTWYMYEFTFEPMHEKLFSRSPYIKTNGVSIVLIKASSSIYKSKKQRFVEHFNIMQPVYEQMIVALTKNDMDVAVNMAVKWMSEMFETERSFTINADKMKEAFDKGEISLFVRDRNNMHFSDNEEAGF